MGTLTAARKSVEEKGVLGALSDVAGKAWNNVKAAGQWVADGVVNTAKAIIDTASKVFNSVTSFISKVWTSFSAHQKEVDRRLDEQRRDQERLEERRVVVKQDDSRHLEDTVLRARAISAAQEFQAQQGLIFEVTVTGPNSQIDNAALERKRAREKAQKAPR